MKIAIGADHGGYTLKEKIVRFLQEEGYTVNDFGTDSLESCDYNDVAKEVARAVLSDQADRGILICGTGVGMSIQANRFKGIRAALVHDTYTAEMTRLHNDSNVLALGGRVLGEGLAQKIVHIWLQTEYSNEARHTRRVDKLENK